MAGETPFGASFGDPRKYMGQSPLAEIGKGLKKGLTAYVLKESGFTDYLNKLNPKPVGAVAPTTSAAPAAVQPPQQSVAPILPQSVQPESTGVVVTPILDAPPKDIGEQILDNKWDGFQAPVTSPVSLQNPTDFNPLAPDTSNQVAMSGNEYQQVPGYGKLQKILGTLFGQG
jgi:hypothetical protein